MLLKNFTLKIRLNAAQNFTLKIRLNAAQNFTLKIRLNAAQNLTFTFLSLWGVPMIAIALRLYAVANMQWQSLHRMAVRRESCAVT
jgi:hypothetical protein